MTFKSTTTWSGLDLELDTLSTAMITIETEHNRIHRGDHFNVINIGSIQSGASINFGITTQNSGKWTHFIYSVAGTTQTETRIFEGATLSGGATVTPINNNRNSANASVNIIKINPVLSGTSPTSGTLLATHSRGLESSPPVNAPSEGIITRDKEILLKSGTTYMMEIRSAGSNNIIDYEFNWYEYTGKSL